MKPRTMAQHCTIPGRPLAAAAGGLAIAAWPLAPHVPLFAVAVFLGALVACAVIYQTHARLPPLWVKLLVLLCGFGGVLLSTGNLRGMEPALGILLILVSLKLLELRTARDFQVLVLLGWFLGLCRLFFEQDLFSWVQAAAVGVLLTGALVAFHGGSAQPWETARITGWIALQAAPLIALLFIFFPRAYSGVRFNFNRSQFASTGMADRLEPGGYANLARNEAKAFRVEFPDGLIPAPPQRYWRAAVLWKCDGLAWERGKAPRGEKPRADPNAPQLRQVVLLRPHGARWLFALDWPVANVRDATFEAGEFLQSKEPVTQPLRYEVFSQPNANPARLHPFHARAALQLPNPSPPRAAALAAKWRASFRDDRAFVDNALRWIREESFSYTLTPGDYQGREGLEQFLFERRAGFCEHYAAAFATLMRLGGVPARLVIGYQGGELNDYSGYLIVRQSDAHAWCEVWLEGSGWTRVDPTSAIAPDRVSASLQSLLAARADAEHGGLGSGSGVGASWRLPWRRAQMMWDNLNYEWDSRVLNYDEDEQRTLLTRFGLGEVRGLVFFLGLALGTIAVVAAIAVLLRRPWRRAEDAVVRGYQRFCRTLARAGLVRAPWEGPLAFGERAARELPEYADAIRQVSSSYVALRYGAVPLPPTVFLRTLRALPRMPRGVRKSLAHK